MKFIFFDNLDIKETFRFQISSKTWFKIYRIINFYFQHLGRIRSLRKINFFGLEIWMKNPNYLYSVFFYSYLVPPWKNYWFSSYLSFSDKILWKFRNLNSILQTSISSNKGPLSGYFKIFFIKIFSEISVISVSFSRNLTKKKILYDILILNNKVLFLKYNIKCLWGQFLDQPWVPIFFSHQIRIQWPIITRKWNLKWIFSLRYGLVLC